MSEPDVVEHVVEHKERCMVCKKEQDLVRCSGCQAIHYCGKECQKKDWKAHKVDCKKIRKLKKAAENPELDEDPFRHKEHKEAFDGVIKKYGLDKGTKADEIADFLTQDVCEVGTKEFAKKFGTTVEDALVFLSWIDVGTKFKQEVLDNAKKMEGQGLDEMGIV